MSNRLNVSTVMLVLAVGLMGCRTTDEQKQRSEERREDKQRKAELKFATEMCKDDPIVGVSKQFVMALSVFRQGYSNATARLEFERAEKLQQEIKNYSVEWETVHTLVKNACKAKAIALFRKDGQEIQRASDKYQEAVDKATAFVERIEHLRASGGKSAALLQPAKLEIATAREIVLGSGIDVLLRNTGGQIAVLHTAEILLYDIHPTSIERGKYEAMKRQAHSLMPSMVYNEVAGPSQSVVRASISHELQPNSADRFLVTVYLAEKTPDGALRFYDAGNGKIFTSLVAEAVVRLTYNDSQTVESGRFKVSLSGQEGKFAQQPTVASR